MYIIQRTDQGGGYVNRPGSRNSYTNSISRAQTFLTRKDAENDRCVENEIVVDLGKLLRPTPNH